MGLTRNTRYDNMELTVKVVLVTLPLLGDLLAIKTAKIADKQ